MRVRVNVVMRVRVRAIVRVSVGGNVIECECVCWGGSEYETVTVSKCESECRRECVSKCKRV